MQFLACLSTLRKSSAIFVMGTVVMEKVTVECVGLRSGSFIKRCYDQC